MTELYSLERPERVKTLEEALGIAADIIDCEKTHEQCRGALSDGLTTEYTVKIAPAEFGGCKVSVKTKRSTPSFEIKFMNGLDV